MNLDQKKEQAAGWFKDLQGQICDAFETLERDYTGSGDAGSFALNAWERDGTPSDTGSVLMGGGQSASMKGRVFEKVGVNFSEVYGTFSPEFAKNIPGAEENDGVFWASGISVVAHMCSPLVPAVHMNTRMIATSKCWFGGGADLTPMLENEQDAADFHAAFKTCCDRHDPEYYPEFKDWCDRYFFLPHRNEPRGIGGIFYDYLDRKGWEDDFAFTRDVGTTFKDIYSALVQRAMHQPWTDEQREAQLIKRGRYVEFNLLYDRGTQFGLKTGGNTDAILMSMPPEVKWP